MKVCKKCKDSFGEGWCAWLPDSYVCTHLIKSPNLASIGTGPWPDDQDSGDPPDTLPMPTREPIVIKPACPKTGATCRKCKTFNDYAEPTDWDLTYVCYSCRGGK